VGQIFTSFFAFADKRPKNSNQQQQNPAKVLNGPKGNKSLLLRDALQLVENNSIDLFKTSKTL